MDAGPQDGYGNARTDEQRGKEVNHSKGRAATALVLCLAAFELAAQSGGGYYAPLSYRDNDPFLFCERGQDLKKNPAPCWVPMPPYTGAHMLMMHCRPPNPYGKDWTEDDTRSYQEYLTTCPQAEDSGKWDGPGRAETTPTDH